MVFLSVLIASAAVLWAGYRCAGYSDRRLLLLPGLPALLLTLDLWMWIDGAQVSDAVRALLLAVHVHAAAGVIWAAGLVRRHHAARERHRRELEEALHDSDAMRRLKSAFLANMNHEIRTPLTSVIGFSSLLMAEVSPEHRSMIRVIERSGQRLLDTLDSFLDLAMLESGRVQLAHESVDVAEEAYIHVERFGSVARSKGLDLSVSAPPVPVRAHLDRACLSRIFSRLISNAIKFTDEGSVTIAVERAEDRCRIAVRDTGIGIDDEYLPYLFDEFTQASTGTGRSFEGAGLGLAVTQRLVGLLHGTITVESRPFEGSTFTVTLPTVGAGGDGAATTAVNDARQTLLPELEQR